MFKNYPVFPKHNIVWNSKYKLFSCLLGIFGNMTIFLHVSKEAKEGEKYNYMHFPMLIILWTVLPLHHLQKQKFRYLEQETNVQYLKKLFLGIWR